MKNFLNFKFFVVLFAVLIIGLLLPFHQAEAWIGALASNIVYAAVAAVLEVIAGLTFVILLLCSAVLNIVINPNFITVPYTSGAFIDIGWPIVRDFANLGFTLALIFIGLATALQLDEYGAKKALPRLLAMALLVNFTPVITGIIVDASNIIMNFFLGATGDFSAIRNLASSHYSSIANQLQDFFTKSVSLEIIAEAVAISAFNLLAGFFFLLYAFLFLARHVAIWTLVIVSPLAFFANVFPKTSSYYKQWWQQFIQWCFIGVPASFFLYLSWHLLDQADTIIIAPAPSAWGNIVGTGPILSSLFVYSVVLVFLFIGFLASLSSGAVGATAIIATAKGWGKSALTRGGKAIGKRTGQAILGSKAADNLMSSMVQDKTKGPVGWGIRTAGLGLMSARGKQQEEVSKIKDSQIDAIIKDKNQDAAVAFLKDKTKNPLRHVKLLEEISEKWGEDDMAAINKAVGFEGLTDNIISMAAGRRLNDSVKKITKDKPMFAKNRKVVDAMINPASASTKAKLDKMKIGLVAIARKLEDGQPLDTIEQTLTNDLATTHPNWFENTNLTSKSLDDIIKEKEDAYYAVAGQVNLEDIVRTMKPEAWSKASRDSVESPRIQQIQAMYGNARGYEAVSETFAPDVYDQFTKPLEKAGILNTVRFNKKLGRSAYNQNFAHLLKKPYAYEPDGTQTMVGGKPVLIEDVSKYDEYADYINGGTRPTWMGTPSSSPPPPPTPVSGAPGFVQTPSGLAVPSESRASRKVPPDDGMIGGRRKNPNDPSPASAPGDGEGKDAGGGEGVNKVIFKGQTGYTYTLPTIDYGSHQSGAPGVIPGGKQIGNYPYQEFKHPLTGQQMIRQVDSRIKSKLEIYVDGKKVNLRMGQEIPVNEHLVIKDKGKTINL